MLHGSDLKSPLTVGSAKDSGDGAPRQSISSSQSSKHMLDQLYDLRHSENITHAAMEVLFRLEQRGTTAKKEIFAGFIQYISCLYIMSLIPSEMKAAGYDKTPAFCITIIASSIGSILVGVMTNFPFVVAPPTAVTIFYTNKLLQLELSHNGGGMGIMLSGICLIACSWRPLGQFLTKLIPNPVQVGTAVGIGLLLVLTGALNTHIVISGTDTVVERGQVTFQFVIAGLGVLMINACLHYRLKGEYLMPMLACTLIWWIYDNDFPKAVMKAPRVDPIVFGGEDYRHNSMFEMAFSLLFLYLLSLSSSITSLGYTAGLIRKDGTLSRNRWLFILCGTVSLFSGYLGGPPVLVAPESITGILAGGRTGLAAVTCGWLFAITIFFEPIINRIPDVATAPIMFVIGMLMFTNVARINWTNVRESASTFVILFFVPFTYSTLTGVIMGYSMYIGMGLLTGELYYEMLDLWCVYFIDDPPRVSDASRVTGEALVDALTSSHEGLVDQSVHVNMGFQDMSKRQSLPYFPTAASIRERVNRNSSSSSAPPPSGIDDGRKTDTHNSTLNSISEDKKTNISSGIGSGIYDVRSDESISSNEDKDNLDL